MRTILLQLSVFAFMLIGIAVGGMAGVYGSFFALHLVETFIASHVWIGLAIAIGFPLIGALTGFHALILLWMLCARVCARRDDVRIVVFPGRTWHPEQWLFRQLYPDESEKRW